MNSSMHELLYKKISQNKTNHIPID